jgi:hypothetical protein
MVLNEIKISSFGFRSHERTLRLFYLLLMSSTAGLVSASTFQIPCQYLGSFGASSGDRIIRDVCPLASSTNGLRMYYFVIDLDPGSADQVC